MRIAYCVFRTEGTFGIGLYARNFSACVFTAGDATRNTQYAIERRRASTVETRTPYTRSVCSL
jgi:hypothetical protein